MDKETNKIFCPDCGSEINVSEMLFKQIENDSKQKYNAQLALEKKKYDKKFAEIQHEKRIIEEEKELIDEKINVGVLQKVKSEKEKIEKRLRSQIQDEQSGQFKLMQDELDEKSLKLRELNKTRAEVERLKREKNELKNVIEAEAEKQFNEKLKEERFQWKKVSENEFNQKIKLLKEENEKQKSENSELKKKEIVLLQREQKLKDQQEEMQLEIEKQILSKRDEIILQTKRLENEKNDLKFKEYEKQLDDQKKLIEEMKRKAEQGSMQIQGEVQELALEHLLRNEFPFDIIEEVPKGFSGADVIQTVINPLQQECGKIIYESKRTKTFSNSWIEKLKEDQRNQQADISILVTEVLPKDMNKFGQKDGVWICTFQEVKGLSFVIREMILKIHTVKSSQENKADKMDILYNYLTGEDFKQRVEAIVEGFSSLKTDLDKEKRALQRIWKEREKQLEKVISNTIDMYGSIKGIAGNAIGTVQALELPAFED